MSKNKKLEMDTFKKDVVGGSVIGLVASIMAFFVLFNLNLGITPLLAPLVLVPLCLLGIFVARFLSQYIPFFYKFGKFGEVGGLNWLIDMGVLNILILITGFSAGIYFSIFKGISFTAAATNSYFWNKFWVFDKNKTKDVGAEVGKFTVSTLTGLLFNVIIASAALYLSKGFFVGLDSAMLANLAAVIGSLSAMVLNFILYKFWVFK